MDIACKCGVIGSSNHPVAKVTAGDWGDEYAAIRLTGGSLERQYEAFIEQITYGHVPQEEANANARLIAAAPDLLEVVRDFLALAANSKRSKSNTNTTFVDTRSLEAFCAAGRAAIGKVTGPEPSSAEPDIDAGSETNTESPTQ